VKRVPETRRPAPGTSSSGRPSRHNVYDCRRMRVGILTGTGTYALPGLDAQHPQPQVTPFGEALVARGNVGDVDVLHISRHGEGHKRLSNNVAHRANIAALRELGADCVLAVTVCGAVDPGIELGSLICFDDLHFPVNRLPDGSLCTFFAEPGDPRRGHWIYEDPYAGALRSALLDAADQAGLPMRDGGCYGHVDGPRFNTRAEIRGLAAAGVTAVSQTAGPETVLAGEAELPFALVGYATDYANGVQAEATPVERLLELIAASTDTFARLLEAALPRIDAGALAPTGVVYRFHEE
jgi:purine nucleoside phosphorylase